MEWLAAKTLFGLPRWGLGLAIAALIVGAMMLGNHFVDRAFDGAEQTGAVKAENAGHTVTLDQLGAAHEAESKIRNPAGIDLYCECLQSASEDTAGSCQRYLPIELVPGRPGDKGPSCPKQ